MLPAPIPPNEPARIDALRAYNILDTAEEDIFDAITKAAAAVCDTPMASLTLVDSERQWFKSRVGIQKKQDSRDISFCGHAINTEALFLVEDAQKDPRFHDNPLVTGDPRIRFYAGMPLVTPAGMAIGTLCVLDTIPKCLNPQQEASLNRLAQSVMRILNIKRNPTVAVFAKAVDLTGDGVTIAVVSDGKDQIVYANESFLQATGYQYHEVIGQPSTFPATDSCPDAFDALQAAYRDGRLTVAECEIQTKNGKCTWDRISFIPYLDHTGQVIYTVAIHRNVTQERHAEVQSKQLHAMQTTIATLNHVVNNFLNAAQLYQTQVKSGVPVDLRTTQAFEAALGNTRQRMAELNRLTEFRDKPTPFGISLLDLPEQTRS